MMTPVTYVPPAAQTQLEINRARVASKPYARFFSDALVLNDDVLPALRTPLDPGQALRETEVDRLLDDAPLAGETGFCVLPSGVGYVASRVPFPGVSLDALRWWWWWHSAESERYMLWYPHCHVSVERSDRETFATPGLTDEQRYVGSTHRITEIIGATRTRIDILFVEPAEMGLHPGRVAASGVVHGCGWVSLQRPPLRICKMIHIARPTADGFELRSRYWLGSDLRLRTPLGSLDAGPLVRRGPLGRASVMAGLAYEQLLHDQTEFTHLAGFLQPLYDAFGPRAT